MISTQSKCRPVQRRERLELLSLASCLEISRLVFLVCRTIPVIMVTNEVHVTLRYTFHQTYSQSLHYDIKNISTGEFQDIAP